MKRHPKFLLLLLAAASLIPLGCRSTPTGGLGLNASQPAPTNPLFVQTRDPYYTWEIVVDVLDDYFTIEHERPVQVLETTLTEGRVDTLPEIGSTVLEPWRHDSVTYDEKIQCTLQPIRRSATARVIPAVGGFEIEVMVYKELEAVTRPDHSTAGRAVFRYDSSATRIAQPTQEIPRNEGWVSLGRDPALEARILAQIRDRVYAR